MTRSNVGIVRIEIGTLEGEKQRENGGKAIVANRALKLLKDLKPKIQEDLQTPRRIIREKIISWYIISASEIKTKRKIIKGSGGGGKTD